MLYLKRFLFLLHSYHPREKEFRNECICIICFIIYQISGYVISCTSHLNEAKVFCKLKKTVFVVWKRLQNQHKIHLFSTYFVQDRQGKIIPRGKRSFINLTKSERWKWESTFPYFSCLAVKLHTIPQMISTRFIVCMVICLCAAVLSGAAEIDDARQLKHPKTPKTGSSKAPKTTKAPKIRGRQLKHPKTPKTGSSKAPKATKAPKLRNWGEMIDTWKNTKGLRSEWMYINVRYHWDPIV